MKTFHGNHISHIARKISKSIVAKINWTKLNNNNNNNNKTFEVFTISKWWSTSHVYEDNKN